MNKFNNLAHLIEHVEKIPESNFITRSVSDGGKGCVIGQVNLFMHGHLDYPSFSTHDFKNPTIQHLEELGIEPRRLADANNNDRENPKRGALKYLRSLQNS